MNVEGLSSSYRARDGKHPLLPCSVSGVDVADSFGIRDGEFSPHISQSSHFFRIVFGLLIFPLVPNLIAGQASTSVVIRSRFDVFRRQLMAVFAVIGERLLSGVFWARHSGGPVFQLFRLNRGVSLPVTFPAQGNQIAQVIGASQPSRNLMVRIKARGSFRKLTPAILAPISIASTTARGLTFPIRAAFARLTVLVDPYPDRPAHRKRVSPTCIRTIVRCPDLRRPSLKFFRAMRTLQYNSRDNPISALTFVRAITRRSIAVIWEVGITTMKALSGWIFSLWPGLHDGPFYPIFSEVHR